MPKPLTSNSKADGRFDKRDFVYDSRRRVPLPGRADAPSTRFTTVEAGMTLHKYWSSACPQLPAQAAVHARRSYRRIARWEHEDVLEAVQQRFDQHARRPADCDGRRWSMHSAR